MTTRRVTVLVSGTGRHLENLALLARRGEIDAEIALCISSRGGVRALERAERLDVATRVIGPVADEDHTEYGARIFEAIEAARADTVVLAGFLKKLWIPDAFKGRVINVHPSLLPAFGGRGYYGDRVHRAVLERGCKITGCTVHLVDEVYDNGPILVQRACAVEPTDTVESLAARVFAEELIALPDGLRVHWTESNRDRVGNGPR